jgi:hypothetical protein
MGLDLERIRNRAGHDDTSRVAKTFTAIIHEKYGRRTFQRIASGGKMETIAKKMVEFARQRGISIRDLLEEAIGSFGVEFCQRVFRTPYPQINVVLTEKTLARLKSSNREPLKVTEGNLESTVNMYMDAMKDVDKKTAIECVEGGWPEGSEEVRLILIERLKGRKR